MAIQSGHRTRRDILRLFKLHGGWLRHSDLVAAGHHPRWLMRLEAANVISRVRRGLYRIAPPRAHTNQSLVDACKAVPGGVICLLSALSFHDLTDANPPDVYLAVGRGTWRPRVAYPPIRFFRFTNKQLNAGVFDTHAGFKTPRRVQGRRETRPAAGPIRVFDREKTLCDCFRHRHVVGQDTLTAALRKYLERRDRDIDGLLRMSRACRVEKRIRPYLEALL
jgi:predicted transcriptional regulator of viral defense system